MNDYSSCSRQQITSSREKLRLTQQELNSANEKNVESAETFRKIIRNLEKQNADLNGDVKIMRQQREHLQKELELMVIVTVSPPKVENEVEDISVIVGAA